MVSKSELERYYKMGDTEMYAVLMQKFWEQQSGSESGVQQLLSPNFTQRHFVTKGSLNKNNALDVARNRSNQFTRNFTSTLVPASLIKKVCQEFAKKGNKRFLIDHVKNAQFKNYKSNVQGVTITVKVDTHKKTAQILQGKGTIEVGLSQDGYISHFHNVKYA